MPEQKLTLGETRSMLRLYFRYIVMVAILSGLFLYVAVRFGDTATVFLAGFLPATLIGILVAGQAFRLGQEHERREKAAAGK